MRSHSYIAWDLLPLVGAVFAVIVVFIVVIIRQSRMAAAGRLPPLTEPKKSGMEIAGLVLLAVFLIPVYFGVATGVSLIVTCAADNLPFDGAIWKRDSAAAFSRATYDEVYLATRDRMVDDLLRRYQFVGMTKTQVTEILDEPDYSHSDLFPMWDLIYWLGPDHRGSMGHLDSKWLLIQCDSNGRVTRCLKTVD